MKRKILIIATVLVVVFGLFIWYALSTSGTSRSEISLGTSIDGLKANSASAFGAAPSRGIGNFGSSDIGYSAESEIQGVESPGQAAGLVEDGVLAEGGVYDDISITDPNRKLIREAELEIESLDFDASISELERLCLFYEGYIGLSEVSGRSVTSRGAQLRYAYFRFRIPSVSYNAFLESAGNTGNLMWKSQSSQDVTYEYLDTESRIRFLRMRQERLEKLLEETFDSRVVIDYENSLTDTLYELEKLESSLRRYDSLVEYSTVVIRVEEVTSYSDITEFEQDPKTVWDRIRVQFLDSMESISDFLTDIFVVVAGNILYITIVVVSIIIIILFVRHRRSKPLKPKWNWSDSSTAEASKGVNAEISSTQELGESVETESEKKDE